MTLYINSCVREGSRTDLIARAFLEETEKEYTELYLPDEGLCPLSEELLNKRNEYISKADYSDPMFRYAKQFVEADRIIISAPFWDLSFPALLKIYIENIYVTGIVTEFGDDGMPHGLCNAGELIYITTSGGPYVPDFSYGYIKSLATDYFGIPKTRLIAAENLDIEGSDVQKIIKETIDTF